MSNAIDTTGLTMTDAVLAVVAEVKGGAACVEVEHLTVAERYTVGKLLGWKTIPDHWLFDARKPIPSPGTGPDFERMILEDQDEEYTG